MATKGHSKFIPVFLGKIVRKKLEQPFLAIPNLYQFFGENCWKKFRMAKLGCFEFSLTIVLYISLECNGLESNERFFENKIVRKNIFVKKKNSLRKTNLDKRKFSETF